jgi:hypothetical protein
MTVVCVFIAVSLGSALVRRDVSILWRIPELAVFLAVAVLAGIGWLWERLRRID